MFQGLSTLRQKATKTPSPQNKALQDYLKRYTGDGDKKEKKSKEKKKKSKETTTSAVRFVDLDQNINVLEGSTANSDKAWDEGAPEAEDDDNDDERPVVANVEEAKRLLQQVNQARAYFTPREDGSGWAPVTSEGLASGNSAKALTGGLKRPRHDSPDLSPPRRQPQAPGIPFAGPRHVPAAGLSPPGQSNRRAAPSTTGGEGIPQVNRSRGEPQNTLPEHRHRLGSPDLSPPRRSRHDAPDLSPPRGSYPLDPHPSKRLQRDEHKEITQRPLGESSPSAQPAKTLAEKYSAGKQSMGLVSAEVLARETRLMKEEQEKRRLTAPGRSVATVYRDKTTGLITTAEEFAEDRRKKKKKKKEEVEYEHLEWKTGLAQKRREEELQRMMDEEASRPFGDTAPDVDHDRALKEKDRWGDPMAGRLKGKQREAEALPAPVVAEDQRKMMGFIIPQDIPLHSWIRRKLPAPQNRYNIRPGRHWDGVDRSNGFENNYFRTVNERAAREVEARMWSQADM